MNKQTNKNKKRLTFLHFHRNALITSLLSVKAFELRASLSWLPYRTSRRNHHWIGEFLKRSFGQYNIFNYRLHFIHFYFFKIQSVSFRKPYMWFNVVYYFSFYLWNPSKRELVPGARLDVAKSSAKLCSYSATRLRVHGLDWSSRVRAFNFIFKKHSKCSACYVKSVIFKPNLNGRTVKAKPCS